MTLEEIKKRARFLSVGNETSTAYADDPLLSSINNWYKVVVDWIEQASGAWRFNDGNRNEVLEAVADLPAGTTNVDLPDGARRIDFVSIRRTDGSYQRIPQIDRSTVGPNKGRAVSVENLRDQTGFPVGYDIEGSSPSTIHILPKVDGNHVMDDEGIIVGVTRDIMLLENNSDTPGIPASFHEALALGAALDYSLAKENDTLERNLRRRLFGDPTTGDPGIKGVIMKYQGNRNKDAKPRFRPRMERYN